MRHFLEGFVGGPVVDEVGLTGLYTFDFQPPPRQSTSGEPSDSGPSIFTAVLEQLGLQLIAQKVSVENIVIDHAEKPTPN